jgi:hypothetical protein
MIRVALALALGPATAAPAAPATPTLEGKVGEGVTMRFGDRYSLNLKARISPRYELTIPRSSPDAPIQHLVGIGTARIWLSGNMFVPKFKYMVQLAVAPRDFREGSISPIYDAFIDYEVHRDFGFRVGQYFVPFDRLRTVREFALQTSTRPAPVVELTLDRDVGAIAYSKRFLGDRSPVAWQLGVFGGGGNNLSVSKPPGALLLARFELRPLGQLDDDSEGDLERRKRPALALGGGAAANFNTNRARSTTGATFTGGTTNYFHVAADLVFKWGGFAAQGEYLWRRASRHSIESTDDMGEPVVEYTRSGQGWIAQWSYVFPVPVEIVGRLSGLYTFTGTDPAFIADVGDRGQEVAAGLNYYLNAHRMKVQTTWLARMPHDFDFTVADHTIAVLFDVTF